MKRSVLWGVACLLGLGAADQVNSADSRPTILFIMTDQQSGYAMSCRMGREYLHTPVMDGLASRGMLFSRAYTANPLCMPARAAIFSGRYPHETRVTHNAKPRGGLEMDVFRSIGLYLRDAGYDTAYSGKWHLCYNARREEEHGFEILKSREDDNYDAKVADGAVAFLEREHTRPFLLVASFLNPHNICEWARRLAGREQRLNCGEIGTPPPLDQLPPAPANLAPPLDEPDGMTLIRRAYQVPDGKFPVAGFTVEDWRRQRWGWYRMIEKVDGEIGKVLAALRRAGLEENTLIIFTSDHGDCAGSHRFNQKTVLYEESACVPLILSWKGHTPAAVTDRLVNTGIDILPTMLEVAGVEPPESLPGRSLWPLAAGRPVSHWRDHVVVENDMVQTGEVDGFRPTMQGRAVRTDRYKYCLYEYGQRRESLYDLREDPGETRNLAGDPALRFVLLRHRALLARFAAEHHDAVAAAMLADEVRQNAFPK